MPISMHGLIWDGECDTLERQISDCLAERSHMIHDWGLWNIVKTSVVSQQEQSLNGTLGTGNALICSLLTGCLHPVALFVGFPTACSNLRIQFMSND